MTNEATDQVSDPAAVVSRLWSLMDRRDWDRLPDVLHPDVRIDYPHTGEVFDRDGYVALNRDYPGHWRCTADELVTDAGRPDRVVARVRVHEGATTYWVVGFVTVTDGLITEATEVWSSAVGDPPVGTRPTE